MDAKTTVEIDENHQAKCLSYEKKDLIKKRRTANPLFFQKNLSKRKIADRIGMSRRFVMSWTKSADQDCTEDNRGWPKGRRRRWSAQTEQRIAQLRAYLEEDPKEFFWGATAIAQEGHRRYPSESVPPLRAIGQILRDLDLSNPNKKKSDVGAAKYLCYPEHTIYEKLSIRLLETDFVGQKYLKGRTERKYSVNHVRSQGWCSISAEHKGGYSGKLLSWQLR
jgi:transposase